MSVQKTTFSTRKRVRIDEFFEMQEQTIRGRMRAFVEDANKYIAFQVRFAVEQ